MTFNSIAYLFFYPIVVLGYFISKKIGGKVGENLRWMWLLATSYFFYMFHEPKLIVLILFTTLVSWICSLLIERINDRIATGELDSEELRRASALKKLCIALTLLTSLGVLFYFKYINFILGSVAGVYGWLSGTQASFGIEGVLLPVGISFYTFQTLSYAIDVYRGDIKTERHFGYYALFVSFFPQLVAGPIERPGNLLPQLKVPPPVSRADLAPGFRKLILGFFKKIVIADLLSVYVNAVYNNVDGFEVIPAWGVVIATVLFAFQIYCDFSGYTDIAIGCARLMGIRLMKNFDHPYIAQTIREFWNRWHLSLSTWFRDYLYFPLGGSRCSKPKHLRNIMIVFLVSGLWHGAAWTFVIWGALHAVYQVLGVLTLPYRNKALTRIGLPPDGKIVRVVRIAVTFVLVDFAWLFFRANSTADMSRLLGALVSGASWKIGLVDAMSQLGFTPAGLVVTVLSLACLFMMDRMIAHNDEPDLGGAMSRRLVYVLVVWTVVFAWTWLMKNDLASTFIYFQF
ncbi:MAG: MBOAT family O-acyltransferase [Eubacteriales bacterium]